LLPNSAHKSVPFMYQFLVLTPLAPVLGANHHRDGLWKLMFSARTSLPGAPTVGAESSPDTNYYEALRSISRWPLLSN
jgi:hypothetical protein